MALVPPSWPAWLHHPTEREQEFGLGPVVVRSPPFKVFAVFRYINYFFGVFLHLAWSLVWTGLGHVRPERGCNRSGYYQAASLITADLEAAPLGGSLFGLAGAAIKPACFTLAS